MRHSAFSDRLIECNGLGEMGFLCWAFTPGMLFGARRKWWGDRGPRNRPHPGLDLCAFVDRRDRTAWLDEGDRVPAASSGTAEAIIDDFLGRTVVIENRTPGIDAGDALYTLYAHVVPRPDLHPGDRVAEGEVIAAIAGVTRSRSGIRPHLHLSLAGIAGTLPVDRLDWRTLTEIDGIRFVDPLRTLALPYRMVAVQP